MEATGLDFISNFICPFNVMDSVQTRHECEGEGEGKKKKKKKKKEKRVQQSRAEIMTFLPPCTTGDSEMNCPAKRHIERIIQPLFNSSNLSLFFLLAGIALGRVPDQGRLRLMLVVIDRK